MESPSGNENSPPDAATNPLDLDGDGYLSTEDDCNDYSPLVNPGAVEIFGDGMDNNCDGRIDEHPGQCDCGDDPGISPGLRIARAMGLCDEWILDVEVEGNPVAFGAFADWGALAPRVTADASESDGLPTNNCQFVILATGPARSPAPLDRELSDLGVHDATDPSPTPDGAEINDLSLVRVTVKVPINAQGFSFDFLFLSTEYPEFVCTRMNDTFTAVVTGEPLLHGGAPTNVSLDRYGSEITVNASFFEYPPYWSLDLAGTGYGIPDQPTWCEHQPIDGCRVPTPCPTIVGSTTGWLRTSTPATPGGELTLVLSIHDEGDSLWDSAVVIDNFRWLTHHPTQPETVK